MLVVIYRHLPEEGFINDIEFKLVANPSLFLTKYPETIIPKIDNLKSIIVKHYNFVSNSMSIKNEPGIIISITYNELTKDKLNSLVNQVNQRLLEINGRFGKFTKGLQQIEKNHPAIAFVREELPYKIPKGYFSWRYMSILIGSALDDFIRHKGNLPYDEVSNLFVGALCQWFKEKYTLYLISQELLKALKQTNIKPETGILEGLHFPIKHYIINFPIGEFKINNNSILFVTVSNFVIEDELKNAGENKRVLESYKKFNVEKLVSLTAIDSEGINYSAAKGILKNGQLFDQKRKYQGTLEFKKEDEDLTESLFNIILQINLILAYEPKLIEESEQIEVKPRFKGFGKFKVNNNKPSAIYPRWVGKNYKIKRETTKVGGTGTSKRPHWRAGHYRNQPYDNKENPLYKVKWIEPTRVNDFME